MQRKFLSFFIPTWLIVIVVWVCIELITAGLMGDGFWGAIKNVSSTLVDYFWYMWLLLMATPLAFALWWQEKLENEKPNKRIFFKRALILLLLIIATILLPLIALWVKASSQQALSSVAIEMVFDDEDIS